jgi:hypothetical protein
MNGTLFIFFASPVHQLTNSLAGIETLLHTLIIRVTFESADQFIFDRGDDASVDPVIG